MKIDSQERDWELIYGEINRTLERFGKEDAFGRGDYLLVDDNWGNHQQKIEVQNLSLIKPQIVTLLQKILAPYPDWEIVVAIDVPTMRLIGRQWGSLSAATKSSMDCSAGISRRNLKISNTKAADAVPIAIEANCRLSHRQVLTGYPALADK